MLIRSLFAFFAMPGVVAYLVPALWLFGRGEHASPAPVGLILLAAGTLGLIHSCVEFHRRGKGTLAPWDPPQHLVVTGLYRYSRNPMYVCVLTVLFGWLTASGDRTLAVYLLAIGLAFQLRIVLGEEAYLARRYAEQWTAYRATVPRWL